MTQRENEQEQREAAACPKVADHYPEPDGLSYAGWYEWAHNMGTTHVQRRCSGCNLWVIWTPREPQP